MENSVNQPPLKSNNQQPILCSKILMLKNKQEKANPKTQREDLKRTIRGLKTKLPWFDKQPALGQRAEVRNRRWLSGAPQSGKDVDLFVFASGLRHQPALFELWDVYYDFRSLLGS